MDSLLGSLTSFAKTSDEAGRKKLVDALYQLIWTIEAPQDLMQRLLYLHVYIAVARAGADLKLFNQVVDSDGPITAAQVAANVGASTNLTARLLRYLASVGALRETAHDTYTDNSTTQTLADPAWQSAIYHNFDFMWPCMLAMPDFIKESGYKDISDPKDCPFNKGHQTELPAFDWLPKQEKLFEHFNTYMTVQRRGMPTWLDSYPYKEKAQDLKLDQAVFVDIGGGVGHQAIALRRALPAEIQNKIIVQDLESVIGQAEREAGVETEAYDFWETQPVKGARMYYMRNIIHDWPDAKAVQILRNTQAAMGPDSVLLIDDMVVPDLKAHWQATQLDMIMMSALASCERSHSQWEQLVPEAGLKINKIYQYTSSLSDSIIECVLK